MTMAPQGFDLLEWQRVAWASPDITPVPPVAKGADWSYVLSTATQARIRSIRAQLVTSSVAGSRVPLLQLLQANGDIFCEIVPPSSLAASMTGVYSWNSDLSQQGSLGNHAMSGLPDLWLPPASTVQVSTLSKDAGDQWSAMVICYDIRPYASR